MKAVFAVVLNGTGKVIVYPATPLRVELPIAPCQIAEAPSPKTRVDATVAVLLQPIEVT